MSALLKRYFTPEEYLLLEEHADYKSQFVAGEIFAMAGAEPAHNKIVANLGGLLFNSFWGRNCDHYFSDMRVRVEKGELYTYPDVSALCGEAKFESISKPRSLLNPQVIIEVLSPSTEEFDRGDKFSRYQKLESLKDYVLIGSQRLSVEHYVRQADNQWLLTMLDQPQDRLVLASVSAELSVADIYERVTFGSS